MAAINDLISQIQDETLRNRIQEEVSKMGLLHSPQKERPK